jgi:AcrR family transcriptional regulator
MSPSPVSDADDRLLSAKAKRTQRRLLDAARQVFERDGFLKARVVDIAKEAGVAHGSFYTYYDSKQQIFRAVVADFTQLYVYELGGRADGQTAIQEIESGNRKFYETYLANRRMFELYEEAASYDNEVREHRIAGRKNAEGSVRKSIERLQQLGLTPAHLDPEIVASCLVAMATHSLYSWHIREERGYDMDHAVRTLSYLWAGALGLRAGPDDDGFYQSLNAHAPPKKPRKAVERAAKKARPSDASD